MVLGKLNQKQFNFSRNQEISHISPVEQVNGFNIEEPSVSYLQLPTGKTADQRVCSRCGKLGHWRKVLSVYNMVQILHIGDPLYTCMQEVHKFR